jgi:hypothetical protein
LEREDILLLIVKGQSGGKGIWKIGGKVEVSKIKQKAEDSMRGGAVQLGEGRGHPTGEQWLEKEGREKSRWPS